MNLLFRDLKILLDSIEYFPPWDNLFSILGLPSTWFSDEHSEFNLLKMKDKKKLLSLMKDILVQRIYALRNSPESLIQNETYEYEDEAWFFVNGIATNKTLLEMNGNYLRELFHRKIELIYNPTDGVMVDLFECIFGRTFDMLSHPAEYMLKRVDEALNTKRFSKVVIMGHSQGGIIISNITKQLITKYNGDDILSRLEIYTFASACDEIKADRILSLKYNRFVPYIEHFVNSKDIVAKIGILQCIGQKGEVMDGEIYSNDSYGHLLNAHYLPGIKNKSYASDKFGHSCRLYEYLNGGYPVYFNPLV